MTTRRRLSCLLLWVTMGLTQAVAKPVPPATLAVRVDSLFSVWRRPDSPGAVCAVVQDGKVVYAAGYGMADLDYNEPLTPASVFHVASLSKQFTAASIALLVLDGRLSLEDDIHTYLPELPALGKPILVRHLLDHTSGLRDYHELLGLTGWHATDPLDNAAVMGLLTRQRELNFAPGSEHVYCNTGYLLLGQIVERITGQPLPTFAEERLFRPLGMEQTCFEADHRQVVKRRVISYEPRPGGGYRQLLKNADTYGDMGLLTTVGDLCRWDRNYRTGQVGGRQLRDLLMTRGVLVNGDTIGYAFGLQLGAYRGLVTQGHTGQQQGFRTAMVRFPEQGLTIIVLANLSSVNAEGLAHQVADRCLAGRFQEGRGPVSGAIAGAPDGVPVDTLLLDTYAGEYQSDTQPDAVFSFTRQGERFIGQARGADPVELMARSDSVFFKPGTEAQVTFHRNPDGTVSGFTLHSNGDQAIRRVDPLVPTAATLAEYVGVYWCRELDTRYELTVVADSLRVMRRGARTSEILVPHGRDRFDADGNYVRFIRDPGDRVIGLRFSTANRRIRNLMVEREE